MPTSAVLIASKGAVIFCALALYGALEQIFDFHSAEGAVWTSELATALFITVCTACAAPFLVKLSRGTGNVVLGLLCEMSGWSWIGASEDAFSGTSGASAKVYSILTFLGLFLVLAPLYLLFWWYLRLITHASPRLVRKMSKLDQEVAGYVFGFSLHLLFSRIVGGVLFGGKELSYYAYYLMFVVQLGFACIVIVALERLRVRIPTTYETMKETCQITLEVTEHALGVSLGFAYLQQFQASWADLVYEDFGEGYEADDATWLEVEDESSDEEGTVLKPQQAWFGVLWLTMVLSILIVSHAFIAASLKFRATSQLKKALRRLSKECASLAFGFATEKAVGTVRLAYLGSDIEATLMSILVSGFVLVALIVRHTFAHKKRQERRDERITTSENLYVSSPLERNNDTESDSDSAEEVHGPDTFELVNAMTWTAPAGELHPVSGDSAENATPRDVAKIATP